VAVGGWMASGKSSVAQSLGRELGAEVLSADEIRAEFERLGCDEAYVPGFSSVVYDEVFERAGKLLARGARVVLDGTFRSRELRAAARRLAGEHGASFRFVECRADEATCRRRLDEREAAGEEGWIRMFDHFLPLWEPVEELPPDEHVLVDSSVPAAGLALDVSVLRLS
jgi:predicted kinase